MTFAACHEPSLTAPHLPFMLHCIVANKIDWFEQIILDNLLYLHFIGSSNLCFLFFGGVGGFV